MLTFLPEPYLYTEKILFLKEQLGSWRAVSRSLGVGHSVLKRRIELGLYKREWDLAADELIRRITGPHSFGWMELRKQRREELN